MAAVDEITGQSAAASPVQLDRVFYRAAWQEVSNHPFKAMEFVTLSNPTLLLRRFTGRRYLFRTVLAEILLGQQ